MNLRFWKHVSLLGLSLVILSHCSNHKATTTEHGVKTAQQTIIATDDADMRERLARLAETMEEKRREYHIPGMALAIVKDDQLIYARGFGHANLEKQIPATPETLFAVGSTTKAFASALTGLMVAEGKMDWDDPVTKYLPEFELAIDSDSEDDEVTIRDMFSHRTGFTRMGLLWINGTSNSAEILRDTVNAEPWAPFRKSFFYNNVMYLAAGEATAKAAGTSWTNLLEQRILKPLKMGDATISYAAANRDSRLALGYGYRKARDKHIHLPMRNLENIAPAGALNANALDMAKWVRLQLAKGSYNGQQIIPATQLTETWKENITIAGQVKYGMGWMLQTWKNQSVVQHGGNIDGFSAMVGLLPESKLGFVLLNNLSGSPLQNESINMVWNHLLGEQDDSTQPSSQVAAAKDAIDFEEYVGEYIADFGPFKDTFMTVLVKGDKLAIDVPGQMVYELKPPNEDGKWVFAMTDTISTSFDRDKDGQITTLRMHQGGFDFELPRKGVPIEPEVDERTLMKYLGTYHSEKRKVDVIATIKNHRLALDYAGQMTFELHQPDDKNLRRFRIRESRGVTFDEAADGSIEAMRFYRNGELAEVMKRTADGGERLMTVGEIHTLRGSDKRAAALKALGPYRIDGRVRFAQSGVEGNYMIKARANTHYREEMDFGSYGKAITAINPDAATRDGSFTPREELEGEFLEQAQQGHPAIIFGDWRQIYPDMEVLRDTTHEGKQVHVVLLKGKQTKNTRLYLDPETGDVLAQKRTTVLQDNSATFSSEITFEDYREVAGLRIPFKTTTSNFQVGNILIQYENVEPGISVTEKTFVLEPEDKN